MTPTRRRPPLHPLKALAAACLPCLPGLAAPAPGADGAPAPAPVLELLDARTRVGFERVHLPGGERMGLAGLTELVAASPEWWFGPGVYSAVTGRRGGLFVPGVEGTWSHAFNDYLAVDAGMFAGGGGGGNAPVGGGLMLRPHLDLVFQPAPGFYTGPTWSLVRFANGSISSHQFGWMFNADSSFRIRPADRIVSHEVTDGEADGLGFDRIDATFTEARPHASVRVSDGQPLTQTIGLVGMRAERSLGGGPGWFGIEAAGAASGGVAGYAEVLGTGGVRYPLLDGRLDLGGRLALGAGGGGDISTGGGGLMKAQLGGHLRLSRTLGLGLEGGLVRAVRGHYEARTATVSLTWWLDPPRAPAGSWDANPTAEATRVEFASGAERYQAARKVGGARPLEAGLLQINRFVTPWFYLSGQAHSAFGGGAGAYSVGLFGLGAQVPVVSRLRLGAEALAGAAGGGGVDTHGGAIVQARAYADVAFTDSLSLRVGAGKVRSVHAGGLDAPVVDAAIVFRFGVDRAR